jgi:hypothetical protein
MNELKKIFLATCSAALTGVVMMCVYSLIYKNVELNFSHGIMIGWFSSATYSYVLYRFKNKETKDGN